MIPQRAARLIAMRRAAHGREAGNSLRRDDRFIIRYVDAVCFLYSVFVDNRVQYR